MTPTNGIIEAGQSKLIEILFEPSDGKKFNEVFIFNYKDSTKHMELVCKGEGALP